MSWGIRFCEGSTYTLSSLATNGLDPISKDILSAKVLIHDLLDADVFWEKLGGASITPRRC